MSHCFSSSIVKLFISNKVTQLFLENSVIKSNYKSDVSTSDKWHKKVLPLQDMFCLYTPGGGGYGREDEASATPQSKRRRLNETFPERGSVFEYRMAQEGVWGGKKWERIEGQARGMQAE